MQQLIPEQQVREWLPSWMTIEGLAITIGCALEVPLCLWGTFKSLSYFSAAGVMSTCALLRFCVGAVAWFAVDVFVSNTRMLLFI